MNLRHEAAPVRQDTHEKWTKTAIARLRPSTPACPLLQEYSELMMIDNGL